MAKLIIDKDTVKFAIAGVVLKYSTRLGTEGRKI
jgi:hypothetical protein